MLALAAAVVLAACGAAVYGLYLLAGGFMLAVTGALTAAVITDMFLPRRARTAILAVAAAAAVIITVRAVLQAAFPSTPAHPAYQGAVLHHAPYSPGYLAADVGVTNTSSIISHEVTCRVAVSDLSGRHAASGTFTLQTIPSVDHKTVPFTLRPGETGYVNTGIGVPGNGARLITHITVHCSS